MIKIIIINNNYNINNVYGQHNLEYIADSF